MARPAGPMRESGCICDECWAITDVRWYVVDGDGRWVQLCDPCAGTASGARLVRGGTSS